MADSTPSGDRLKRWPRGQRRPPEGLRLESMGSHEPFPPPCQRKAARRPANRRGAQVGAGVASRDSPAEGGTPRDGLARRRPAAQIAGMTSPGKPRVALGWGGARVLALGHSTRPFAELVELLAANGVAILADIRTVPRSRHNPQYDQGVLRPALERAGISYHHLPRLGGLRRARADSPNGAWRNASFRGFADYMLTPEFEEGLLGLRELARQGTVAVMCAEAVPWRCHRSLLADRSEE